MAPTVSVLLLAYRQEGMVGDAVASLLAQQGPTVELILSDDASPDGTFDAMTRAVQGYAGPHTVILRRNATNLGIGAHLNELVRCSSGELLVIAAGDDLSEPTRVEELVAAWEQTGRRADLVASHLTDLDEAGHLGEVIPVDDLAQWTTPAQWVAKRPYVVGAAHAWTRRVFEKFGPFDPDTVYEDQVMTFRALASGGAVTVPRPLVRYRRGGASAGRRDGSRADKFRRMQVQNRRHLAELRQLRQDATRTSWGQTVMPALEAEWQKQAYLADLLAAEGTLALVRRAVGGPPAPLGWRWRKFVKVLTGRHALQR